MIVGASVCLEFGEGYHLFVSFCWVCFYVVILLERVLYVSTQVLELLGEGDKYSFYFYDRCLFSPAIFFVFTCVSLFLTLFFLEVQDGVCDVSER